jgi:type IV secretory pathway VirB10-like protein
MRLAVYGAVLAIALGSVLFGLDWLSAPMSPMVDTKAGLSAVAPAVVPRADVKTATTPPVPAAPANAAKPIAPPAPAQPKANIGAPGLSPSQSAATQNTTQNPAPNSNQSASPVPVSSAAAVQATADVPGAPAEPQARCNVSACTAAYRSFMPADCTYQPSNGPRRLCTK